MKKYLLYIFGIVLIIGAFAFGYYYNKKSQENKTIDNSYLNETDDNSNDKSEEEQAIPVETSYDTSTFFTIELTDFLGIYKKQEKSIIFIGRSTCPPCKVFLNNLKIVQKEYDLDVYYLSLIGVDSTSEEYKSIEALDEYLLSNFGTTPMFIITEGGKLAGEILGSRSVEEITSFLKEYGVI